jgi:hypothetical protein
LWNKNSASVVICGVGEFVLIRHNPAVNRAHWQKRIGRPALFMARLR